MASSSPGATGSGLIANCRSSTGASSTRSDSVTRALISWLLPFVRIAVVTASAVSSTPPSTFGARSEATSWVAPLTGTSSATFQVITPPDSVPPPRALTKLAPAGTSSVTVVSLAAAAPRLVTSISALNSSPSATTAVGRVYSVISSAGAGCAVISVLTVASRSEVCAALELKAFNVASMRLPSPASSATRILTVAVRSPPAPGCCR